MWFFNLKSNLIFEITNVKSPIKIIAETTTNPSFAYGIRVYEKDATPWISRISSFRKIPDVIIIIALIAVFEGVIIFSKNI